MKYDRAPGVYLMFPSRYVYERSPNPDWTYSPGVNDIVFMSSRDGLRFDRSLRDAFIRPGLDQNNWHDRGVYIETGILQTSPTEISLYGMENSHLPSQRILRYTLRTDGFVSVNAGYAGGELTTVPVVFEGRELEVNYSTSAVGSIRVEIQKLVVNGNNEYDGTGFFNSGAPFDPGFLPRPVSVRFTQAGVYQVVCLIHPNMQATVTVLQDGFTAPESQADLDARAASERTSLIAHAESLFAASKEAGSQRKADFTMEHRLKTGLFQDDVEYARYFPDDLEVSAGDTVTWDWVNGGDTPHTVTFLSGAEAPEYLLVEHKVFADGSLNVRDPPTIAVNSEVFEPSGGDTYSGSGVFNSGVLFGEQGPPGRPTTYSLRFDTPGAYHYHCLMHGPVMSATITVTGAALAPELPSVGDDSVPVLVGIAAAASALLICGGVLVVRWRRAAANTSSSSIENKTWRGT